VGANPPDETPVLRASVELYGKHLVQATAGETNRTQRILTQI